MKCRIRGISSGFALIDLQRKKYNIFLKISICDPLKCIMEDPIFIAFICMEESIRIQRVNAYAIRYVRTMYCSISVDEQAMQRKMASFEHGIVLLYLASLFVQCLGDCVNDDDSITCSEVPQKLSDGVKNVYIKGIDIRHNRIHFPLEYWKNVTLLDIEADKGNQFLNRFQPIFRNLSSLQYLGLHSEHLAELDKEIFLGLLALKTLDLSNCYELTMQDLGNVFLLDSSIPNIENLYLNNMMGNLITPAYLSASILDNIAKRPIKSLNVSGISFSKIEINSNITQQICRSLEVFNASNTLGVFGTQFGIFYKCAKLTTLDISGTQLRLLGIYDWQNVHYNGIIDFDFGKFVPYLESIYYNQIKFGAPYFELRIIGATLTCINCNIGNLSNLYFSENSFKWLNVTFINCSSCLTIKLLDVSRNGLEYISPNILYTLSPEDIDFRANHLHIMETFPDFEQLFKQLTRLRKMNLSNNMLTYLPKYLFINNKNLEILDLSTNRLKSFTLSFENLNKLKHLNLRHNSLTLLNKNNFNAFSLYIQTRFNETPASFHVDFRNNNFACTCEGSQFITWLYLYLMPKMAPGQTLECIVHNQRQTINDKTVMKSHRDCNRTERIITVSVLSLSLSFVIVITGFMFLVYMRRRKREKKRQQFIATLQNDVNHKNIILCLFCTKDLEFLVKHVSKVFTDTFRNITGMDDNLFSDNFKGYKIGFPLINEADRCIRQAHVIAFLVSHASCECKRCLCELRLALHENKLIVVILKEQLDEDKMPPIVRLLVRTTSKARFVRRKQNLYLSPSPKKFCNIMLDLASS